MIIEREGRKYYVADNATFLDENNVWQGISDANLIPYDLYLLQQEKSAKQTELDVILNTTDAELIIWARENNPIFQEQANIENRINELNDAITNYVVK